MTLSVSEDKVEQKLLEIIKQLKKEGLLPQNLSLEKTNEIVHNVKQNLIDSSFDFSPQDLANCKQELRLACVTEYFNPGLEKETGKKLDYTFLLQDKNELGEEGLKEKISDLLKAIMALKFNLKNKNQAETQKIDGKLDPIAEDISKQIFQNMQARSQYKFGKNTATNNLMNTSLDLIKEGFRERYGVDQYGGLSAPVLSLSVGNQMDFPNYAQKWGYDSFYMEKETGPIAELGAERDEPDSTKPEPNPLKAGILDVLKNSLVDDAELSAEPILKVIHNTAPKFTPQS